MSKNIIVKEPFVLETIYIVREKGKYYKYVYNDEDLEELWIYAAACDYYEVNFEEKYPELKDKGEVYKLQYLVEKENMDIFAVIANANNLICLGGIEEAEERMVDEWLVELMNDLS